MALTARFINHLFSYVQLIERGLYLDAANCARSATETTAFYWLVCCDPAASKLYDETDSPRPVEIRKRLEDLGIDVSELKDVYGVQSSVSHVGNKYDNIQIHWKDIGKDGRFFIGGGQNAQLQKDMLQLVSAYIVSFIKQDESYEV